MKLLVVTCLKEYQQTAISIIEEAQIKVFSITSTVGRKEGYKENMLDDWFASGEDKFDSIVLFSFTEDNKAVAALELLKKYNAKAASDFPIRGFILSVDQSSY